MSPFDFLFSVLFETLKKSDPSSEDSGFKDVVFKVIIIISILFALNLMSIFPKRFNHESFTLLFFIFVIINLYQFYYKSRHKGIIEKYHVKYKNNRLLLVFIKIIVIIYIGFSLYPIYCLMTH